MTQKETAQVLSLIFSTYKREFKDHTDADKKVMLGLWTKAFEDKHYVLVMSAVEYYIFNDTSGFAPSIGNIKEIIKNASEENLGGAAAWEYICKAASNSIYHSKREFDKLPPLVQRVVGSPAQLKQWAMMDESAFNTTVKREFMKEYKALEKQDEWNKAVLTPGKNPRLTS